MILQPGTGPIRSEHYLVSSPDTVRWGWLPDRDATPVLRVADGATVTIDAVSHEGLLEDFGHDPRAWFGRHGVPAGDVLADAVDVAKCIDHDRDAGPHVVTGPIVVDGAEPGDLLRVDILELRRRVPYGVISNRHGLGALPEELPEGPAPDPDAGPEHPEKYRTVSLFTRVQEHGSRMVGALPYGTGRVARFPIAPFLGIMGVAPDVAGPVNSTPPGRHAGNLDIPALGLGSRLYLPVQVPGAGFYVGDPHFAQGNGEVCLTALEGSLRADVRLTVVRGDDARGAVGVIENPLGETDEHWIPVGLNEDLDEAMRDAVRQSLRFLESRMGMERRVAYAYLSAAADFEVSQVVDGVKGVHCRIRKRDFL